MTHSTLITQGDRTIERFVTDRGVLWIGVRRIGVATAELFVSEEGAALSARGRSDEEFMESPQYANARNTFGVRLMRSVFAQVKALYPSIRLWKLDPRTRVNKTPKVVEV